MVFPKTFFRIFCKNWVRYWAKPQAPACLFLPLNSLFYKVGAPNSSLHRILAPWLWASLLASFPHHKEEVHLIVLFIFEKSILFLLSLWTMPLIPSFLLEGRDLRIPQKTERILVPGTVSNLIQVKPHFLPVWNMSLTPCHLNNKTMS